MSVRDAYDNEILIKIDKKDMKSTIKSVKNIEKMLKNAKIKKIELELKIGYIESPW